MSELLAIDGLPPVNICGIEDGNGGENQCLSQCPWLVATRNNSLQAELYESVDLTPQDFQSSEQLIPNSSTSGCLRSMGVRHPEIQAAVLTAEIMPCDGPYVEKQWKLPFFGKRFGPLVMRCSNLAIPWGQFPHGTHYPGRKALTSRAK